LVDVREGRRDAGRERSMRLIMEQGYDVEQGRAGAYRAWLREYEEELAKSCPNGVEYIGTYAVIYGDQRRAGAFRTLWRFESYGAQDAYAEAAGGEGRFGVLLREAMSFGDWRNEAHGSQQLLKAVVDATIFDPEPS
jgi:hypothetical protein